jgi:hypothetical protein
MLEASSDAWEAVQVVRVSDETMAAAAEALAPGLAAEAGGAWAVAPLLLHRFLAVER